MIEQRSESPVTVVIPAYNLAPYIARCLDSVLKQTLPPDEIIVVDDGSTDGAVDIVQGYGPPVRLLRRDHQGASAARNAGIQAAAHEWIAFLDGDDEWLPDHLERHRQLLDLFPDLQWSCSNAWRCYCNNSQLVPERPIEEAKARWGRFHRFESYFQAFLAQAKGNTDTMLVKRDLLLRAGLFRPDLPRINDMDMWFRMAHIAGPVGYITEPTAIYHIGTPQSIIKTHKDLEIIFAFMDHNLALARKHDRLDDFLPCAAMVVGDWLGWLLCEGRGRDVREILARYGFIFRPYTRLTTWIASFAPRTAARYEQCKKNLAKR